MTTLDLGQLFRSFRHSAFRLECLPSYAVTEDDEAQAFYQWLNGEQPQEKECEWPKLVASAVAGKSMQRVRLVSEPPSQYLRFQMAWGYPANVAAGEVFACLTMSHRACSRLISGCSIMRLRLYWRMIIKERFLRPVAAETVTPYCQARDLALACLFRTASRFTPERNMTGPALVRLCERSTGTPV
jgi:hypothetical protein